MAIEARFGGNDCNSKDTKELEFCDKLPCPIPVRPKDQVAQATNSITTGLDLLKLGFYGDECKYDMLEKWLPNIIKFFETSFAISEDNSTEALVDYVNFIKTVLKHLKETERLMKVYTWEDNQDVVLLGVRKAGKILLQESENQKALQKNEKEEMKVAGENILQKFGNCQAKHLEEALTFLFD